MNRESVTINMEKILIIIEQCYFRNISSFRSCHPEVFCENAFL